MIEITTAVYEKFENDLKYVHKSLEKILETFNECVQNKHNAYNNTVIISMLEEIENVEKTKKVEIVLSAHHKIVEIEQV